MKERLSNKIPCIVVFSLFSFILFSSCKKSIKIVSFNSTGTTARSVTPPVFDWETVDWMPTPSGQSLIPPPWIGQGSLSSLYGIDVVNDHKVANGWVLLYNTFDANASGPLVNPYFILYNKYRGLMRIYLYTTTQFVSPSTYIVDGLSVVSNRSTSMLNFLGTDIVDPAKAQTSFSQIEPAPSDGSQPLASNKWYMLQYEIAYDPQIVNFNYQDIQLSWFTNFNSVSTISLGGTETGTIKSTASAPGTELNKALINGGKVLGVGALAVVGSSFLSNNGNETTGINSIGLPTKIFSSISKGVSAALSTASGNIPGAIVGIFNAIFGGSSSPTVNLNLNTTIALTGTDKMAGSFPSSPTSIYIPGTTFTSNVQGYIPLYNQPLGIVNATKRPVVKILEDHSRPSSDGLYHTHYTLETPMSDFIVFNPAIYFDATVKNINAVIVAIDPTYMDYPDTKYTNGVVETVGTHTVLSQSFDDYDELMPSLDTYCGSYVVPFTSDKGFVAIRLSFDIIPKDGSPKSSIIKTFLADTIIIYNN